MYNDSKTLVSCLLSVPMLLSNIFGAAKSCWSVPKKPEKPISTATPTFAIIVKDVELNPSSLSTTFNGGSYYVSGTLSFSNFSSANAS
jgi:hypothetical protein